MPLLAAAADEVAIAVSTPWVVVGVVAVTVVVWLALAVTRRS